MKNVAKLFTVVLVVVIVCAFAACKGAQGVEGKSAQYIVVTFDMDGGEMAGDSSAFAYKVLAGGPIPPPVENPTRRVKPEDNFDPIPGLYRATDDGTISHTFDGWYHNGARWDFNRKFSESDIIFKAGWNNPAPIVEVSANDIERAFTYVSAHSGTFLMLLGSFRNPENPDAALNPTTFTRNFAVAQTISAPGGHLFIEANVPATISATINATVASATGHIFTLNQYNSSVTIGKNVSLQGAANSNRPVVRVENGASFTMNEGSRIFGNTNQLYADYYAFRAGYGASAVYLSDGTFTMNGGTIGELPTVTGGGNVSSGVSSLGYGGTQYELPGNAYCGGAVILNNGSRFTMNDGLIKGNSSTFNRTTAVNVANGTFAMNGGSITGNSSAVNGYYSAAVYVNSYNNAQFEMTGGSISNNTNNTGVRHDVFIHNYTTVGSGKITLSEKATIGVLTINAANINNTAFITIAHPGFTEGAISTLNLRGEDAATATVTGWWYKTTNTPVIVRGANNYTLRGTDLEKFASVNFLGNGGASQLIAPATGTQYGWQLGNNVATLKVITPP